MGGTSNKPEYTGMDKYPGWIATIITIIVGGVFLGALAIEGSHGSDHGAAHGDDHGAEHHDEAGHDEGKKEAH